MKYIHTRVGKQGFALPTVMIASIVMLAVLVSGLAASSSVNVSLRDQVDQKQQSMTIDAGNVMADTCLKANSYEITWSDMSPLRPNTDCYGADITTCLTNATNAACFFTLNPSINPTKRTLFDVLAVAGINNSVSSEATTDNLRASSGSVVNQTKDTRQGAINYTLATNVSAGGSGTCAIGGDKKAYCWGYNYYGNNGNGDPQGSPASNPTPFAPYIPPAYSDTQTIARGYTHTCSISTKGVASCWGNNDNGQLGSGNTTYNSFPATIQQGQIPSSVRLISITNGYYHSCAIASNSKVYCWGRNNEGQLGLGNNTSSSTNWTPREMPLPAGVIPTMISSSYLHTCLVGTNKKVYCWGRNNEGQIGNNAKNTTFANNTPTLVNDGAMTVGAVSVTTGYYHTCAVGVDGASYCWGQNSSYQLGLGDVTERLVPTKTNQGAIPTSVRLTQITSYYQHTCALGSDSLIYCWGPNAHRQLGIDNNTTTATTPVLASGITNASGDTITGISAGDYHTCANSSNGKLYCWGYNVYGGLGNGNSTSPSNKSEVVTPFGGTTLLGVNASTKIAAGGYHTCALGPDEWPYCVGDNLNGYQLGNNNTGMTGSTSYVAVARGEIPLGVTIKNMWAGLQHTCALASNQKAYCWGNNSDGQLGRGSGNTTSSSVPVAVSQGMIPNNITIRSMSLGTYFTCAVGSDYMAYCWGSNGDGQLGRENNVSSGSPVKVTLQSLNTTGETVRAISAGGSHACLISSIARVYCWGNNYSGQLGLGYANSNPVQYPINITIGTIPMNTRIRQIAAGADHTCALTSSSRAYCWGSNAEGQLGTGITGVTPVTSPVAVTQGGLPSLAVREITAGFYHSCAVAASNSRPYCWGYNNHGQIGRGASPSSPASPGALTGSLPANSSVRLISTAMYSSCVLMNDGRIYCWGYNNSGNVGNGSSGSDVYSPVATSQRLSWQKNTILDSAVLQY